MNRLLIFFLLLTTFTVPSCGGNISDLEKSVQVRAKSTPETALDYFLEQIEGGATVEEQAIYLYGMGLAEEKQGNIEEAISNYLGVEILGNESAVKALKRLEDTRK